MSHTIVRITPNAAGEIIRPELYGHFTEHLGNCIDQGIWVGESSTIPNVGGIRSDVLDALRQLHPPVVRWPGGCFADDYYWEDGIGPRGSRPRRVNLWWGQDIETNAFGTHEFIQVCRTLGAEPYLAGNVASGTPRELRDWVEYCNFAGDSTLARRRAENGSPTPFGVRYWGVGNEAWGCGGHFSPDEYACEYRRFATFVREFNGVAPFLIACGPDGNNLDWTRQFLEKLGTFSRIHGFAAHYYCGTAGPSATEFSTDQYYELLEKALRVENLICEQREVMDQFDPQRRIGLILDEWGTWHPPTVGKNPQHLWQQNTLRDALVAALSLDAFNRQADKLVMANIAQTVNVLQAMILTEDDKMITTPTYHVFAMYRAHQRGLRIPCEITSPRISFAVGDEKRTVPSLSGSCSIKGELLTLSIVNLHATLPVEAELKIDERGLTEAVATVLTHQDPTAHNTFDNPSELRPRTSTVESANSYVFLPASVTVIRAKLV